MKKAITILFWTICCMGCLFATSCSKDKDETVNIIVPEPEPNPDDDDWVPDPDEEYVVKLTTEANQTEEGVYSDGALYYHLYKVKKIASITGCVSDCRKAIIPNKLFVDGVEYTVTHIEQYAFAIYYGEAIFGSLEVVRIPNTITVISTKVFCNCPNLRDLYIPSCMTRIEQDALFGFTGELRVHISDVAAWCRMDFGRWHEQLAPTIHLLLDDEEITELRVPEGITDIKDYAFCCCKGLEGVVLPESVTRIGECAFQSCSLTSINLPSALSYMGRNAFERCDLLAAIDVPEGISVLRACTFYNCCSLMSVSFSENLVEMEDSVFWMCSRLDSVEIPRSVKRMGRGVFGHSGLNAVTLNSLDFYTGQERSDFRSIDDFIPTQIEALYLEETVSDFNQWLFLRFRRLKTVAVKNTELFLKLQLASAFGEQVESYLIPENITSIPESKFSGCKGLKVMKIPEGVTEIEHAAFFDCESLPEIHLPEGVTLIGKDAFNGCKSLTEMKVPEGVQSMGNKAFGRCTSLVSVNIPKHFTSITDYTFYGCSSLPSIDLPSGVTSIGEGAFEGCSSLTSITIPEGVTSISKALFKNCYNLPSITLPSGVTTIGSEAFSGCTAFTSFTIPDGVTSISNSMLSGCTNLTSVRLHEGVTTIGASAFSHCEKLASLSLPESITSIGGGAFSWCAFESLTLPRNVGSVGANAFQRCEQLFHIYCYPETPPDTQNPLTTYPSPNGITLHVPAQSLQMYRNHPGWGDFQVKSEK